MTFTIDNAVITNDSTAISETKQLTIDCDCNGQCIKLQWLTYLDNFDEWSFTAEKEYQIDITDTGETTQNIFPEWPRSYGETASTIRKQTYRNSQNKILVRSQNLTLDQLNAISYIRTSPLVQIINSRTDVRTVIVDNESFRKYDEGDKLYSIEFTITYTDQIPSQTV